MAGTTYLSMQKTTGTATMSAADIRVSPSQIAIASTGLTARLAVIVTSGPIAVIAAVLELFLVA